MKKLILITIFFLIIISCQKSETTTLYEPKVNIDLKEIIKKGKLTAITGYSATSYFIYRGRPMGYEYELLNSLAKHLNVKLEIIIAHNMDEIFTLLNQGKGDIVADNMTITKSRKEKVAFTDYHSLIRQVLVQKKPDNWRQMKLHEIDKQLIRNPIELIGKNVHIRKGAAYYSRIQNLSEEIGGEINIVEMPGEYTTEKLIKKVAEGEIEYTISDDNIAKINQAYYSDLDVETAVSFPQRVAWVVRKNSPELLSAVNEWLKEEKKGVDYYTIYNKYFKSKRRFKKMVKSELFTPEGGKISPYDELIKEMADSLNWDWRIIASQIYQESHFDPKAKSWVGAKGLLQLMPNTAKEFGA
ncbi:MAG: lytic transglycosylase F, partial [Calditrichia bacterium]|nr:lytic transglycosylase F [Calditrichia bacterium]